MNKNCKVIYKKIEPNFLKKYGYINLNQREVNTKDDLVEISSIFRNPMYETFRIIYMKNNKIVGHEQISTKLPNFVPIFSKAKNGRKNAERCFYKIHNRMKRLASDGYYMVHNHPSGNARASNEDLKATEMFNKKVAGFKGHLIVNLESYAWIDVDSYGQAHSSNYLPISNFKKDRYYKMMTKKSIYDVKILCRNDLVYLMHHIKNSLDYSTAILTDCMGKVRMIMDIPNRLINIPPNQLNGYFNNLSKLNGTTRVFFATSDNETYKKSLEHFKYGTFTDSICYKVENNKIYTYETVDLIKNSDTEISASVFSVHENSIEYKDVPDGKIRILYKPIGKPSIPLTIPNTLESKQQLVGGLIEVIQYDDALLICNDEGKILNMPPNLIFDYDYIAGDCFVIGDDYENGDFRSLTFEEIEKYKKDLDSRSIQYKKTKNENTKENPLKEIYKLKDK